MKGENHMDLTKEEKIEKKKQYNELLERNGLGHFRCKSYFKDQIWFARVLLRDGDQTIFDTACQFTLHPDDVNETNLLNKIKDRELQNPTEGRILVLHEHEWGTIGVYKFDTEANIKDTLYKLFRADGKVFFRDKNGLMKVSPEPQKPDFDLNSLPDSLKAEAEKQLRLWKFEHDEWIDNNEFKELYNEMAQGSDIAALSLIFDGYVKDHNFPEYTVKIDHLN